jgi:hypothetical protein
VRGNGLRVAGLAVLAGILGLAVLLALLPGAKETSARSVYSVEASGRRAAFLLLRELGHEVEPWTRAPGHLPHGEHLLLLGGVPQAPPGYASEDPERLRGSRRLRDLRHYRRFVEQGGTLVTPFDDESEEFLREVLGMDGLEGLHAVHRPDRQPSARRLRLASGEELEVEQRHRWFESDLDEARFEPFAVDALDRPVILRSTVGNGSVVLLADPALFQNALLREADHALLLVRLAETLQGRGRVLFDEYSLGGWVPASPLELAFAPGVWGFSAHLAVLVGLLVVSIAWVRSFPRDPEPLRQLSALDRAAGIAGWISSMGRWDLLGRMLRRGVLRRLARRSGVGIASADRTASEDASRDDERLDRATIERVLRPYAGRFESTGALAAARDLFETTEVRGAGELARLATEFVRLESLILTGPTRGQAHG